MEKEKELYPVRKEIINHVHSINGPLSIEYLNTQPHNILLANCHPSERKDYIYRLGKEIDPILLKTETDD